MHIVLSRHQNQTIANVRSKSALPKQRRISIGQLSALHSKASMGTIYLLRLQTNVSKVPLPGLL